MTPEEAKEKITEISKIKCQEMRHIDADDLAMSILRELGYGDFADIFEKMGKWYA